MERVGGGGCAQAADGHLRAALAAGVTARVPGGAAARPASADLEHEPVPDLLERLGTTAAGLDAGEAEERLQRDGPNELPERHRNPLLAFLGYYWGPIPWMIEAALGLSVAVERWADAVIIGVLLAMNGVVAFWEEHQAAGAIEALKDRLAREAPVRRSGRWRTVPARELVVGDLVRLRIGDVVPADTRVIEGGPLQLDQSALTGESLPVDRAVGSAAWSGSIVVRGEADAVVYATGTASFMGRTTQLVEAGHTVSHFQQAVLRIGNFLIVTALALVVLILGVGVARGNGLVSMLEFCLVVTVAAVPVALPAVLSVTMAVGAGNLARRQAVVSHLPAVEELGGVDVLCSDKTGTLTRNELAAGEPAVLGAAGPSEVLVAAALASRAEDRDPIDQAVLAAAGAPALDGYDVVSFEPFDPVRKRTEAAVAGAAGARFRVSKGAPQVIAALADGSPPATRERLGDAVAGFATRGDRSLAVARADGDGPWRLLGVIPLFDPPRDDSRATLAAATQLGIDMKMVTGDQLAIARQIAGELAMGADIADAGALDAPDLGDEGLDDLVESADGFAQVFPEHKYRIVQALQARGHIVAMTGDGLNDAPALKQADAGIAVAGATDAARAAADVVLLSPGLSVIVDAIRLARETFRRMTSYAIYRIAETIRVLLLITASILVFNFFPVTAVMIVLLALLNDGAILTIAYDRAEASARPVTWNMHEVLTVATVLGVAGVVASFTLFAYADQVLHLDRDLVRTLMYLKLSVAGHLTIFVARTHRRAWQPPHPAPVLVGAVLGTQAVATLIAATGLFVPAIGWARAGVVWAYALAWFAVNDALKVAVYGWLARRRSAAEAAEAAADAVPALPGR